jgi:hypothetical protein
MECSRYYEKALKAFVLARLESRSKVDMFVTGVMMSMTVTFIMLVQQTRYYGLDVYNLTHDRADLLGRIARETEAQKALRATIAQLEEQNKTLAAQAQQATATLDKAKRARSGGREKRVKTKNLLGSFSLRVFPFPL